MYYTTLFLFWFPRLFLLLCVSMSHLSLHLLAGRNRFLGNAGSAGTTFDKELAYLSKGCLTMMSLWLVAFCIISISCHLGATEFFLRGFFCFFMIFNRASSVAPQIPLCRRMLGSKPRTVATNTALAVRRALTTRLALIPHLIHTRLDLIHRIIAQITWFIHINLWQIHWSTSWWYTVTKP